MSESIHACQDLHHLQYDAAVPNKVTSQLVTGCWPSQFNQHLSLWQC